MRPSSESPERPITFIRTIRDRKLANMEVFVLSEPLYDVCESWAEEPSFEAWDAVYSDVREWLVRAN